jgi:hypothetical protein
MTSWPIQVKGSTLVMAWPNNFKFGSPHSPPIFVRMTSRASVEEETLTLSHLPEHVQGSVIVISYRDIPKLVQFEERY